MVAEEGGFDEGADDLLFVGVELVEGGEVGDCPVPGVTGLA